MGAGAGPPRNRVAHKGLLAWGACVPAPLSSHSEPGPPRQGHRLRPRAWTLALPLLPTAPARRARSLDQIQEGERAEGKRGGQWQAVQGPILWAPPLEWGLGVGSRGRPGSQVHLAPQAGPARSHAHLGGLYLFNPPAQPLPGGGLGAGPVLNKQIQMEPGSAAALDLPLSPLPSCRLMARRMGNKGYGPSLHVPHVPGPHSSTAGSTAVPVHTGNSC